MQGAKQSEATPRVASSRAQENGVLCVLSLVVAVFEFWDEEAEYRKEQQQEQQQEQHHQRYRRRCHHHNHHHHQQNRANNSIRKAPRATRQQWYEQQSRQQRDFFCLPLGVGNPIQRHEIYALFQ